MDALDYLLPPERIAQVPLEPRDAARLMVCDRTTGAVAHRHVCDLPELLPPNAMLVVNSTRVRPARLFAEKPTGGIVEVLVLRELGVGRYRVQLSRRRRLHVGNRLVFFGGLLGATLIAMHGVGEDEIEVEDATLFARLMRAQGEMPVPPYITAPLADPERYQTVFAEREGSAAAPTAGLHFTPPLLAVLRARGIAIVAVELQVGLGTFEPVRTESLEAHRIHSEYGSIDATAARILREGKRAGRPLVAVGTTTTRLLEHVAKPSGRLEAFAGEVDTFITPGFAFRAVDRLLTNFHLPRSSLLGLVAAFAGRERVLGWYAEAIAQGYRFYSFGDAMLIR